MGIGRRWYQSGLSVLTHLAKFTKKKGWIFYLNPSGYHVPEFIDVEWFGAPSSNRFWYFLVYALHVIFLFPQIATGRQQQVHIRAKIKIGKYLGNELSCNIEQELAQNENLIKEPRGKWSNSAMYF